MEVAIRRAARKALRAIKEGRLDGLQQLVHEWPALATSLLRLKDDVFTLLMVATRQGKSRIVEYLLDQGAPIDTYNQDGKTALAIALDEHQSTVAQVLLERGANIHIRDHKGYTMIHFAAFWFHNTKIMRSILCDGGMDMINAPALDGYTPLDISRAGWSDVAELLLGAGADPVLTLNPSSGRNPIDSVSKVLPLVKFV
jgi:hypothetical protein